MAFRSPYPAGAAIQVSVAKFDTGIVFAIPPDGGTIFDLQKVNLSMQARIKWFEGAKAKAGKRGEFVFSFQPPQPGLYRLMISYNPDEQQPRDSRFADIVETEHLLIVHSQDWVRKALVDDAAEALDFMKKFSTRLRTAVQGGDEQLEQKMKPLVEEARRRVGSSWHPGTYMLMCEISGFLHSRPPTEEGKDRQAKYNPAVVDVKFKPMPVGCLRESYALAAMGASECLDEAVRLASADASGKTDDLVGPLRRYVDELSEAVGGVGKLDITGTFVQKLSGLKLPAILKELKGFVDGAIERDKADPAVAADLHKRLDEAIRLLCLAEEWEER